jgi:CheY-like chemotaxis protein
MLKRILIIDDDCEKYKSTVEKEFEGSGIEIQFCSTKDDGLAIIRSKPLFNCIVLDWYLEEENSTLSRLILSELKNSYFAPVLVFSNHAQIFREEQENGTFSYPSNLIREVDKDNFSDIKAKTEAWINENYTAKLANIYLAKVYESIHKTFLDLIEIPDGNIASVYKNVISENGNIDWANDFIINLISQRLISDGEFIENISALVDSIDVVSTDEAHRKKVINKLLYLKANTKYLTNGDIVKIVSKRDPEIVGYGIVTNPDCDLSQKNTRYIELVKLVVLNSVTLANSLKSIKENSNNSHFYLPNVQVGVDDAKVGIFQDLVGVFKSKFIVHCSQYNQNDKYPMLNQRAMYSSGFYYHGEKSTVEYICSLVNPYKSEFFQKKNTHDSRVGIPNIYEYLRG